MLQQNGKILKVKKCGWCQFSFDHERPYGSTLTTIVDETEHTRPICKTCTRFFLEQEEKDYKIDVAIVARRIWKNEEIKED